MRTTLEVTHEYHSRDQECLRTGQDLPVCDKAQMFAQIAGTTTLLPRHIERIQVLGFKVLVKQKEMKL